MNAVEIEQAISDLALVPFDAAEFPFAFLAAFGHKDITLKRLRAGNNNTADIAGGVLLRSHIHIAVCAAGDITVLRHVRSNTQRQAAEEIADCTRCADFEKFAPLFERAERELKAGIRAALRFGRDASIANDNYFILGGQLAYVAEVGEIIKAPNGESDARLRVIYANGTESNLLRRSLQRALYKGSL